MNQKPRIPPQKLITAILLSLIILTGFFLRSYYLNFPSIGYHNMKENENISIAKYIRDTNDFVNRKIYFYDAFSDKNDFGLYPQIPFTAYQIFIGYKLFGDNLWFPRLINIIFMLLSILCMFWLIEIFLKENIYSLSGALLLSIMPLGVYFSRNLQPESGAFFFMLLGNLMFMKFIRAFKKIYWFCFALCLTITTGYKIAFLIGFVPLLFIFPYKKYISERRPRSILKEILLLIFPVAVLFLYWIYTKQISFSASWKGRVDFLSVFSISYWEKYGRIIWHYAQNENFTTIYFLLFSLGIILLWINRDKDKSLFGKYLRAWSITIIPYFMVFSDYLNQHNYYQMPFLSFVCLAIVYFIKEISSCVVNIFNLTKKLQIFLFIFAAFTVISLPDVKRGIAAHFRVIYPGTDVMGKSLKKITEKNEKFFIYTFSQGYAPCVYAEKKCGWAESLDEFKANEQKFKIRYVVIYPYHFFKNMDKNIKDYLTDNYRVKIVGLTKTINGLFPTILLLEKGGKINTDEFLKTNNLRLETVYNTIDGPLPFYIISSKS